MAIAMHCNMRPIYVSDESHNTSIPQPLRAHNACMHVPDLYRNRTIRAEELSA